LLRAVFACVALAAAAACTPRAAPDRPDLGGLYRPAGLEVQPCGRNEWMRRSFETDTFCNGDDSGFPFTEAGLARWRAFNVIDDPVLGCIEDFPRNAMRGRPMKLTIGEDTTEIAYWFANEWFVRTVHMNGTPAPADTPHSVTGYSTGRWSGDTLVVETTHTRGGPMFNDHKLSGPNARFTERYWRAPDGANLIMEIALDDKDNYTKPFVLNRQEWLAAPPDFELSQDRCEPSSIWERRMRAKEAEQRSEDAQ
jgi:hypothetical protein